MSTSESRGLFAPGDVVKVPFPYTDRATRQRRPALVVSSSNLQRKHGLSWVLMITSAQHRGWEGDVEIDDLAEAGLPAPSVVRGAKIATIDSRDAEPLGRVPKKVLVEVIAKANALLNIER